MTISLQRFLLSIALAGGLVGGSLSGVASAQELPPFDFGGPDNTPDPVEDFGTDPGPRPAGGEPEELAAPALPADNTADSPSDRDAANAPSEEEASRLVEYNAMQNPWLPVRGEEPFGWLEELAVPPGCLDCTCDGKSPGEACRVWRSFQKPTHPAIDQDCVVCVKEPVLGYVKEHYTTDAVVQKCFVSEKCFTDKECADGRCIETRGTKTVKQLHPCKARVKLFYWKPVVEYRDVYYYINCEPCNEADQQVALKDAGKQAS